MNTTIVTKTRTYVRPATETREERTMVCINDKLHVSMKQLNSMGYSNAQALIGNKVSFEYYAKGDKMFNEVECTKDETIIKSFEVEASADDVKLSKAVNAGIKAIQLN